jgi:uncharacterized low-complexity protein
MKTIVSMRTALAVAALGLAAPAFASDATRDARDQTGAPVQVTAPKEHRNEVAPCGCAHCGMQRSQELRTPSRDDSGPSGAPTAGMRSGRR